MRLNKGNTKILVGDGASTEVFTALADATDIQWTGFKYETVDVTVHNTTARAKGMATTLYDAGQVTFSVIHDETNTNHTKLFDLSKSGLSNNFQIKIENDVLHEQFAAFVQASKFNTKINDVLRMDVTLQINGATTTVS